MNSASRRGWTAAFARLSTSQKLIIILTLALMPMGVVALITSLTSARTADDRRQLNLEVAATEAARKLQAELTSDVFAMRGAVASLDARADSRAACARLNALLATNPMRHVPAALFGPGTASLCASPSLADARPSTLSTDRGPIVRRSGDVLDIIVVSASGSNVAIARYRPSTLAQLARPSGFTLPYELKLTTDEGMFGVLEHVGGTVFERTETATVPVGIGSLELNMTVEKAPFGAAETLLAFLPLLMWAAAVAVGFYVVDRFLVRPLMALRAAVAQYEPGASQLTLTETPATEIRELETSFADFADRLAERERDLETALADQVKLTREVHHRVKNNLQVIASLISLHARGNSVPEAQQAYTAIQRRVDALSIVHRNHYAELERNLGIDVRTLISELVANFRANAGQAGPAPVMTVAVPALTVGQDTATPLAFLFTEIAEMALFADPSAPVAIAVTPLGEKLTARLSVTSQSLAKRKIAATDASLRIVEALARQLRSQLEYDEGEGSYAVTFTLIEPPNDD